MAIDANSYGSTDGVAALTPRYANASGVFDATTRPILTTVEGLIDQLSGILNTMLAEQGFTIPISQTTCKLALDMFVNEEAAAVVEGINGSGRFGPTVKVPNKGRFMLIMDDVQALLLPMLLDLNAWVPLVLLSLLMVLLFGTATKREMKPFRSSSANRLAVRHLLIRILNDGRCFADYLEADISRLTWALCSS
jgi:hypothetical protein